MGNSKSKGSNNDAVCTDSLKSSSTPCTSISVHVHLFAAGAAAAISAVATQPLEVLKIRLQTNVMAKRNIFANLKHIFRAEGSSGLYRGLAPTLGSVVPSISIYFTLYNSIKRQLGCPTGDLNKDVAIQAASAGLASSATAAITNPLWLIKTRLQSQPIYKLSGVKRGTFDTFRCIVREEGVRGLYKGLGASFLASSQAMVQFPIYETLKSVMCSGENQSMKRTTVSYFAASAISASLACILTYPAEVVRARLQAQHGSVVKYDGIGHAFRKIWAQEGAAGLYRGLFTSILKMTPAHAISFTAYEFILRSINSWKTISETANLATNETTQINFRPFLPPSLAARLRIPFQAPIANPRTPVYTPSFSHLVVAADSDSSNSELERICRQYEQVERWSEYFW